MRWYENISKAAELLQDSNRAAVSFLIADVKTALTFAKIASQADRDSEMKNRNRANARRAYDTIMHFRTRLNAAEETESEMEELDGKLRLLKSALERLGESLP